MNNALDGVAPVQNLGVIRAHGEEAAKFLHGQLTQDFALLQHNEARLSALCTAKGRMLASFIGFKAGPDEILLVCSRDILAPTLKRLGMFVLRAKVRFSDASDAFALRGLAGSAVVQAAGGSLAPWAKVDVGPAHVVGLYPAEGVARALWVAPADAPLPSGAPLSAEEWLLGEVRSGVATLSTPVVEAFVPQMLNYESVGGVNFKKGCYPGQEIVARSQFRGTLKRRAFVASSGAPMASGDEVFQAGDESQPCATVVQVARAPDGGYEAIVSGQVGALQSGSLRLGSVEGAALQLRPLPYPLLEDI